MRYRSKPSEVEAIQWTGDNPQEVINFTSIPKAFHDRSGKLMLLAGKDGAQGYVEVPVGHYIVRQPGDYSDQWPVEEEYFENKYEKVDDEG